MLIFYGQFLIKGQRLNEQKTRISNDFDDLISRIYTEDVQKTMNVIEMMEHSFTRSSTVQVFGYFFIK